MSAAEYFLTVRTFDKSRRPRQQDEFIPLNGREVYFLTLLRDAYEVDKPAIVTAAGMVRIERIMAQVKEALPTANLPELRNELESVLAIQAAAPQAEEAQQI